MSVLNNYLKVYFMMFSTLLSDPALFIAWIFAVFYGLTIHEFFHAWSALWQGDETAYNEGRLTLNPFAHLDMWGLFMLVVIGFGWGKPVPINPNNFKHGKLSDNLVSLAGIFSNLLSLIVFSVILKLILTFTGLGPDNLLVNFLFLLITINLVFALFNLIPIPPLDGSHILFNLLPDRRFFAFKERFAHYGPIILLVLLLGDSFLNIGIFSHLFGFFLNLATSWL